MGRILTKSEKLQKGETYTLFTENWFFPNWSSERKFIGIFTYATVKALQMKIDGELRWFPKKAILRMEENQ